MKTELAFNVMEKILPYVEEIMNDDAVKITSEDFAKDGAKVGDVMSKLLPLFITKHRDAMFSITGALNGITADEVKEQDFAETVKSLYESKFIDEMFGFFIWCLRLTRKV